MRMTNSVLWITALTCTLVSSAHAVPEQCLQLPERTEICDHTLYKRSPVDVPATNVKKGEMVCLCMADFLPLRIEADSEVAKIEQQVELSRSAKKLNMTEQDLLTLIRQ